MTGSTRDQYQGLVSAKALRSTVMPVWRRADAACNSAVLYLRLRVHFSKAAIAVTKCVLRT